MKIIVENVEKRFIDSRKQEVTALKKHQFYDSRAGICRIGRAKRLRQINLTKYCRWADEPSSGEVYFGGVKGNKEPLLSIVFQEIALFPWRTVYENVVFGLEERGASKEEQREKGRRYIEMVGLSGFESAYPKQLSGGMRQRAGIARHWPSNRICC